MSVGEFEPTPTPTPPSPEQEKPLTITLSNKEQALMLNSFKQILKRSEMFNGHYDPEVNEKEDLLRKIVVGIAKHLGKQIEPEEALFMGMPEFIPHEQLQAWANMEIKPGMKITHKNYRIMNMARGYIEEEAQKQNSQQP